MSTDWCPTCGGSGYIDEASPETGTVFYGRTEICPTCSGTGEPAYVHRDRGVGCLIVLIWAFVVAAVASWLVKPW